MKIDTFGYTLSVEKKGAWKSPYACYPYDTPYPEEAIVEPEPKKSTGQLMREAVPGLMVGTTSLIIVGTIFGLLFSYFTFHNLEWYALFAKAFIAEIFISGILAASSVYNLEGIVYEG